jgi:hypothetical protein
MTDICENPALPRVDQEQGARAMQTALAAIGLSLALATPPLPLAPILNRYLGAEYAD